MGTQQSETVRYIFGREPSKTTTWVHKINRFGFSQKIRFLHAAKFNKKKAYQSIYSFVEWQSKYFPLLLSTEIERAFVYFYTGL